MARSSLMQSLEEHIEIGVGTDSIQGNFVIPASAKGCVLFAHGSGSSRLSPRNRLVAERLQEFGLATLLVDLLTAREERVDLATMEYRFNIELLASRLLRATEWLATSEDLRTLAVGYFGASTGAAAALIAAAQRPSTLVGGKRFGIKFTHKFATAATTLRRRRSHRFMGLMLWTRAFLRCRLSGFCRLLMSAFAAQSRRLNAN